MPEVPQFQRPMILPLSAEASRSLRPSRRRALALGVLVSPLTSGNSRAIDTTTVRLPGSHFIAVLMAGGSVGRENV